MERAGAGSSGPARGQRLDKSDIRDAASGDNSAATRPDSGIDQRASHQYRGDIDGLRAVAVLSIVISHLGFGRLGGGYVGVDIFFVISGYLIGCIVVKQIQRDSFSVADFYMRRLRRIIPALATVLAVTSVAVWFILFPKPAAEYGASLVSTTLFGSNFYFLETTGYFRAGSEAKVLLHTWSLAVEEQFYVVFPLFMLALRRLKRDAMIGVIAAVALGSLVASIVLVHSNPTGAFYMLPTRLWELLLGALAEQARFSLRSKTARNLVAGLGLACLLLPILLYTPETPFPGLAAIPPCLGTAMLLVVGARGGSTVSRALALRPLVFFGLISYSLYLWHWPVIVLLKAVIPTDMLSWPLRGFALALSVSLAWISWRLIERPWRNPSVPPRRILLGSAISGIVLCGAGLCLMVGDGFPGRFKPEAVRLASIQGDSTTTGFRDGACFVTSSFAFEDYDRAGCLRLDPHRVNVLLVGDSHAAHLWLGLRRLYPQMNLLRAASSGCKPVVPRDPDAAARCNRMMEFVFDDYLPQHRVDWVILAGAWNASDASKVAATLDWLREKGIRVILAGPVVRYHAPLPQLLALAEQRSDPGLVDRSRRADGSKNDATFRSIARRSGALYFSTYRALCGSGRCQVVDADGMPVQFDNGHLTGSGSDIAARGFPMSEVLAGRSPHVRP